MRSFVAGVDGSRHDNIISSFFFDLKREPN